MTDPLQPYLILLTETTGSYTATDVLVQLQTVYQGQVIPSYHTLP